MKAWHARLIAFIALVCVAQGARADDAAPPPEYPALIQKALTEYDLGNLAEARALFNRANALYPNARTQRCLGMVEFEFRNYVASIEHLEAALASQVKPLSGTLRADTEALLVRAKSFVGHYQVDLVPGPQDSRVTVDDIRVELDADHSLTLAVGEHVVEVQAPGYQNAKRLLSVKGGEQTRLVIELRPLSVLKSAQLSPVAEAPGPAAPALATQNAPAARDGSVVRSPWLWTGVGAVVVGAAVVAAVLLLRKRAPVTDIPAGNAGAVKFALTESR